MRTMVLCLTIVLFTAACATGQSEPAVKEGIAVMHPASGSSVKGVVRFTEQGSSVKVTADLEGLPPNTSHGFHIHEFGDCSAADASSAGSHYDPAGTKHHGKPNEKGVHAGDMGNLSADAEGKSHYEVTLQGISLEGTPILGRGVIVHEKADDFGQPVGNAGGRVSCGVIGVAKPKQ